MGSTPAVVVIDDEAGFNRSLVLLLQGRGHPALGVTSPFDALEAIDESPTVRLVLVDVRMPEIDGRDFVRAMGYLFPHVNCALMSAYSTEDDEMPPGIPFLKKPFIVEEVLELL